MTGGAFGDAVRKDPPESADVVPLREATAAWFRISLQTFGGPAGQIAVMQRALVDERRWIGQRRFLHALNYCMLLPGPEAQQLAVYTGWLLNGTRGGLIAGVLFVLPGLVALLALTVLTLAAGDTAVVVGLFAGLAPAVIAIVLQAVHRVGRRALTRPALVVVAVLSFLALTVFRVPFPLVVAAAGATGWVLARYIPALADVEGRSVEAGAAPLISDDALHQARPSLVRTLRVLGVGVGAWFAPVLLAAVLLGPGSVYVDEGLFFAGAAVVTFGGAYAVLAFVAQQAVQVHGWLTSSEMVHGLALAETTPGPLIMVTQWVGGLGAFRSPAPLDPWVGMIVGSLLTTWVTFVPSFLFILLGAPYVERLRHNRHLTAVLNGITAAVVGVIANLALYFALHTLFADVRPVSAGPVLIEVPDIASWDPLAFGIAALALLLLFWRRWSTLRVLGACAAAGLVATLLR
ncbi:chromate efflux transporter [Amnibacterium sp. CER49]|uniref:chromate efflux transporter n=1 Tax=Amnibacterium sp. CER49 TaxID=3039161 RepID=UPI0024499C8B|nr:chromate efflux transporter [Amnibacterium sp. CER49]MDH2443518.1 chromate efflux transporter [Amnibacterium sp. CER49]